MIHCNIHLENPHKRFVDKAVEALKAGELIVYPTDTVYGIGCSIYNKKAIEKLYRIKKKSKFQSMSIICDSVKQAAKYARVSNYTFRILKRCFPGPFTIILEATRELPRLMLSRKKEVGIRIPDNPVCLMLVEQLGHPIVNTSANIYEEDDLEYFSHFDQRFSEYATLVLDAGELSDAEESTILMIKSEEIEILREGRGKVDILFI